MWELLYQYLFQYLIDKKCYVNTQVGSTSLCIEIGVQFPGQFDRNCFKEQDLVCFNQLIAFHLTQLSAINMTGVLN